MNQSNPENNWLNLSFNSFSYWVRGVCSREIPKSRISSSYIWISNLLTCSAESLSNYPVIIYLAASMSASLKKGWLKIVDRAYLCDGSF